jgi:hypothetical protein
MAKSSFIKEVEYNTKTGQLDVTMEYTDTYRLRVYKSKYRYFGVPPIVANTFKTATSQGNFYNKQVKDQYQSLKIYNTVENTD